MNIPAYELFKIKYLFILTLLLFVNRVNKQLTSLFLFVLSFLCAVKVNRSTRMSVTRYRIVKKIITMRKYSLRTWVDHENNS